MFVIKQITADMFNRRGPKNIVDDVKKNFRSRKLKSTELVRGVNSGDLNIYVSNTNGNPNKDKHDKHIIYNNLKDNSRLTTFNFFNEVIKLPEPPAEVKVVENVAK